MLKIKKEDLDLLFRESRKVAPAEACGILVGRKSCGEKVVEEVVPVRNVLASPVTYEMDAEEILWAFDRAERADLEVIGFFHSHPLHEPFWSTRDEERSEYWVGHSFLIISLKTGEYRCYHRGEGDRVEEERVIIV